MNKINIHTILRSLANTHPRSWLLAGFLIVYVGYFIHPIFFSSPKMQFPAYVPVMQTIGGDLSQILGYSKAWAILKSTPYVGENPYPPFVAIFFAPFLSIPFLGAYKIVVWLSLISFVLSILFLTTQFRNESGFASIFIFVFLIVETTY